MPWFLQSPSLCDPMDADDRFSLWILFCGSAALSLLTVVVVDIKVLPNANCYHNMESKNEDYVIDF